MSIGGRGETNTSPKRSVVSGQSAPPNSVRRKTGEVRQPRPTPFGETEDRISHERGTTGDSQFKGTKGTKGNVCRGDASVLAYRYRGEKAAALSLSSRSVVSPPNPS